MMGKVLCPDLGWDIARPQKLPITDLKQFQVSLSSQFPANSEIIEPVQAVVLVVPDAVGQQGWTPGDQVLAFSPKAVVRVLPNTPHVRP
tara:strand:+ start:355 stop:621 length:267 start_codon:yes stop_codon:yes gene_type:complete